MLDIPPERIDRITRGQVSSDLPAIRTYFRTKYQLDPQEISRSKTSSIWIRRNRHDTTAELHD